MSAALDMTPPATLEEFLDWEPYQDVRYEWDGVQPFAMTGGSFRHTEMATRLSDALRPHLRGSACTVIRGDLRVWTARRSRVRYPDLVVTCSPMAPEDLEVPEPVVIIEILSFSTTAMDRGVKRAEYSGLPSLKRYAMLAQEERLALVCAREDGFAERRVHDVLDLPELGFSIPLATLYDGLTPEFG